MQSLQHSFYNVIDSSGIASLSEIVDNLLKHLWFLQVLQLYKQFITFISLTSVRFNYRKRS